MKLAHCERDKTIWLGAVLTTIPHKVTVTVQLHVDVFEVLRQQALCEKNTHQTNRIQL